MSRCFEILFFSQNLVRAKKAAGEFIFAIKNTSHLKNLCGLCG
jgi:hypothetical protein